MNLDPFNAVGPIGPQDFKWKSMIINDKPMIDQLTKISKLKQENLLKTRNKLEEYVSQKMPIDSIPTRGYGEDNENSKNIQRQNEWLRQYSKQI